VAGGLGVEGPKGATKRASAQRRNSSIASRTVAPAAPLPQPMLARSGPLPTRGDWSFEVKWDGFRAIVSTEGTLRVRSRRGRDMTELVPEFAAIPVPVTVDAELVAFDDSGSPYFPLVCEPMLMRRRHVAVRLMIFDLLSIDGRCCGGLYRRPCSAGASEPRRDLKRSGLRLGVSLGRGRNASRPSARPGDTRS
jgi:ATP-dependent DNA ligase